MKNQEQICIEMSLKRPSQQINGARDIYWAYTVKSKLQPRNITLKILLASYELRLCPKQLCCVFNQSATKQ